MPEPSAHVAALYDALRVIRTDPDWAFTGFAAEAEAGDAEALEWAASRLSDLRAAAAALEAILEAGIRAGALTLPEAASELGVSLATIKRRCDSGALPSFEAPNFGKGPRTIRLIPREAIIGRTVMELDLNTAIRLSEILDVPVDEVYAIAKRALADQAIVALEAADDPSAPLDLQLIAAIANAQLAPDVRITALQPGEHIQTIPAGPVPEGDVMAWQLRRLTGKLRLEDPMPTQVTTSGYAAHVFGDGVLLEKWLRGHGYPHAAAVASTYVFIG